MFIHASISAPSEASRDGCAATAESAHDLLDERARERARLHHHLPAGLRVETAVDEQARVFADAGIAHSSHSPFRWTTSPSHESSPPFRRSLTRSQCRLLSFLPPMCV